MSHYYTIPMFDEAALMLVLRAAGPDFSRLVGYFGDDGARCIALIEQAHGQGDAVALVDPAHKLKGEARQLGARRLGDISAEIERTARRCIEQQQQPGTIDHEISMLRICFSQTLALLCELTPRRVIPASRRASAGPRLFGRRAIS